MVKEHPVTPMVAIIGANAAGPQTLLSQLTGCKRDVSSYKNSSPKMSKLDFFIWSLQNRNHYEYNRGIELPLYFETDVSMVVFWYDYNNRETLNELQTKLIPMIKNKIPTMEFIIVGTGEAKPFQSHAQNTGIDNTEAVDLCAITGGYGALQCAQQVLMTEYEKAKAALVVELLLECLKQQKRTSKSNQIKVNNAKAQERGSFEAFCTCSVM